MVDTKYIAHGNSFAFSRINFDQIRAMSYMATGGTLGGYICWFHEPDKIVLFPQYQLLAVKEGSSLKSEEGFQLGSIHEPDLKGIFDGRL